MKDKTPQYILDNEADASNDWKFEEKPKKEDKRVVFTIADDNNLGFARNLEKTFKHFHPDIEFRIICGVELKERLELDRDFFYRATPKIAEELFNEGYTMVLKIDADSLITGSLDYVFNTTDYDIGTVINWNRIDPRIYGVVQGWGIQPPEYMNCGFVAMRSKRAVHHWRVLCETQQFYRLQYREQDLLNIIIYYGNYNCRCFDMGDGPMGEHGWYGLIAKGEWSRAIMKDGNIVVPQGQDNFPPHEMKLNVIHWAGGQGSPKMNYRTVFTEEVADYIDSLLK